MSTAAKEVPIEKRCECCWDFDNSTRKGVYRREYQMVMCIGCLRRTKRIEDSIKRDKIGCDL